MWEDITDEFTWGRVRQAASVRKGGVIKAEERAMTREKSAWHA